MIWLIIYCCIAALALGFGSYGLAKADNENPFVSISGADYLFMMVMAVIWPAWLLMILGASFANITWRSK